MAITDELNFLITREGTLENNKVASFCYEQSAYENDQADGVDLYNPDEAQNIPLADNEILQVNPTVLTKGYRSQASSITRMLVNHFFGRTSYNLNKVNDVMLSLLNSIKNSLNAVNGIAKLDENANIPVAHGGTGASDAKSAQHYLLANMNEVSTEAVSTTEIVCAYTDSEEDLIGGSSPGVSDGAVYKRPLSTLSSFIHGLFSGSNSITYTASTGNIQAKFGTQSGTVCEGSDTRLYDKREPTSHASSATTYGVSSATNYGHAKASSTSPKANGTASAGSETGTFARGDHVHPLQTSVSGSSGSCTGNSATATKLQTARIIDGITFDGSAAIYHFANCVTAKATAAKTITLNGFSYQTGSIVRVMFTNGNSAENPTLNVTSNSTALGAKNIKVYRSGNKISLTTLMSGYWRGAVTTSSEMWQNYTLLELLYDGTDFVIINNPIIENYVSSDKSKGYLVRADGYVEQWAKLSASETATSGTMKQIKFMITGTFNITYSSAEPSSTSGVATANYGAVYNVTTSGFYVDTNNGSSNKVGMYYTARGYVW